METTQLVSKDLIRKTIIEDIDLKPLRLELIEIEKELKDLEKQPDTILVPNDFKFQSLHRLKERAEEINKIINIRGN